MGFSLIPMNGMSKKARRSRAGQNALDNISFNCTANRSA